LTGGDSLKLNLIVVLTGMFDLTKVEEFSKRIFSKLELISFTINFKQTADFVYKYFFGLISLYLIVNNLLCIHQRVFSYAISPDEIENSHNAWSTFTGLVAYKDFFDSGSPLFTLINSFIIFLSEVPASFDTLILLRLVHFSSICLVGVMIFLVAKEMKLSINASLLSVAAFYMWDVVSTFALEIRPDGMQTLFMLIGFYIFIKYYKQAYKRSTFLLVGASFGLMFFIGFNSLSFLIAFVIFAIFEIFTDKDPQNYKKFVVILLGFMIIFAGISLYFLIRGAFVEFQFYYFVYNLDFSSIAPWTKESSPKLMHQFFIEKDIYLSLLALLGFFTFNYSETKNKLMLICLLATISCYFIGFYPNYAFVFLPFCSILAASFIDQFLLVRFYESNKITIRKLGVIFSLYLLFGSSSGNLLKYSKDLYTVDIKRQEISIDWVLKNIPRSEEVALSKHACAAYVFNKDIRYFRRPGYHENKVAGRELDTDDLFDTINSKNTKYFFAHLSELEWTNKKVQEFLLENFDLLNINGDQNSNCVWVRKVKEAASEEPVLLLEAQ
jgi:hypothetical protein